MERDKSMHFPNNVMERENYMHIPNTIVSEIKYTDTMEQPNGKIEFK